MVIASHRIQERGSCGFPATRPGSAGSIGAFRLGTLSQPSSGGSFFVAGVLFAELPHDFIDFLRVAVDYVVPANVLGQGNSVRKRLAVLPVHVVVELAQQKSRKVKI